MSSDDPKDKKDQSDFVWIAVVILIGLTTLSLCGFNFKLVFSVLAGIIVTLVITITVHEMGHAIAGLMAGLSLRYVQLWRFSLVYNNHKWHFQYIKQRKLQNDGSVAFTTSNPENLTRRMLTVWIGGPAASAILVFVAIALLFAGGLWKSPVWFILISSVIFNNSVIILTLIFPKRLRFATTDGQMIRVLLNGDQEAFRLAALHIALADNQAGIQPHDWSTEILYQAGQGPCRTRQHCILLDMAYTAALSHQDFDLACELMDSTQDYLDLDEPKYDPDDLDDFLRHVVYLDIAFFEAYYRNDPVNARRWLDQVPDQYELNKARARAESAILLVAGHFQEAIEKAEAGKPDLVKGEFITGGKIWAIDELDTLIAEAEKLAGNK